MSFDDPRHWNDYIYGYRQRCLERAAEGPYLYTATLLITRDPLSGQPLDDAALTFIATFDDDDDREALVMLIRGAAIAGAAFAAAVSAEIIVTEDRRELLAIAFTHQRHGRKVFCALRDDARYGAWQDYQIHGPMFDVVPSRPPPDDEDITIVRETIAARFPRAALRPHDVQIYRSAACDMRRVVDVPLAPAFD